MAKSAVKVDVDGVSLMFEVEQLAGSQNTSRVGRAKDAVLGSIEQAQQAIVAIASTTVATVRELGARTVEPDEAEVKFGIKFTAEGSVLVANAAGEASLEVTLRYRRSVAAEG